MQHRDAGRTADAAPVPAGSASVRADSELAFDRLVQDYYRAWFHFHPEAAVAAGVDGYADRLTPYHDDAIGALVSLNENLLGALDELKADGLDADRHTDYRLLQGAALIELHELMEADWRYRDPARFLPVAAIYQLTIYPVPDFSSALQSRLAAVPGHLRGARRMLLETAELIPMQWLEAAVIEAETGAQFLRDLPAHPRVARVTAALGRTAQLCETAARAVQEFAQFLEHALAGRAQGVFACGRAHFERILRYRHFLDVDADVLHGFGTRLYEDTRQALLDITRQLRGDEDMVALARDIGADRPAAGELLDVYRAQMQSAYEFVRDRQLVSLPLRQRLQVLETPRFLRHLIPFAAYSQPSPNDPDQCGRYYVSPVTDEAGLAEHNHAALMHTCVHEAWPGHHLQFVRANQATAGRTLPRLLNPSATLYEGWALYCEQLMQEQGFLNRPEHGFILLRDRLWRALRVQLDVELHCRDLSLAEGVDRLVDQLGFGPQQAKAELLWYSRAPGVPMGYATGWALLNRARQRRVAQPAGSGLRTFHDQVLAAGSIALPLVLERTWGAEFAHSVQDAVLRA